MGSTLGTPYKPYGDPTLITHRDLQKVYILNKYHFPIFIYYKETNIYKYDNDKTLKKCKNKVFRF